MPNIAALLKSEITRIARKEGKAQTQALMKSIRAYRSDIAELKRRVQELERALRRADKGAAARLGPRRLQAHA